MTRSADDLSALSRRKALSDAEERRFEVYLGASHDARLFHEIGCDYDRMPAARPEDAALLARVRNRVLERHARSAAGGRRRFGATVLVAFALLSAGVAAAAAGMLAYRARSTADAVEARAAASSPRASVPAANGVSVRDAAPVTATSEPLAAEKSPSDERAPRSEHGGRAVAPTENPSTAPLDARALFSRANAERKTGRLDEALRSYAELRRSFPGSPEAALSHVLSGRLLFARGDAERAAADFGAYLARNPNGTLAEEALHGKAEALRALGRSAEERRTWERLLERFPSSIHARTARERLSRDR